jgi:hypothetical protein
LLDSAGRAAATARKAIAQPFYALTRLVQLSPTPLRRLTARTLLAVAPSSGGGAAARMIALDLLGRRGDALAFAEARAGDPAVTPDTRLAMARASLALKALSTAERLTRSVEGEAAERPGALILRADLALRTGHYREALDLCRRARAGGGHGAAIEQVERRAASELKVLEPGWRPRLPGGRRASVPRTPGRVLHLVTNSLPERQAGYTVRSQAIGVAQRQVGLDPHFATQAGFPRNQGSHADRTEVEVDGVAYHRLDPQFDRAVGPQATVTRTAATAADLVDRLRPAVLHPATNFHNAQVALALRDHFGLPVVYEVRGFLEETWVSRQDRDSHGIAAEADRYHGA